MRTRITTAIVAVAGLALVGTVIATTLFARAGAFERLSEDVRPTFTDEAIATQQADVDALEAFANDLPSALSLLAGQAGLTPEQLEGFLAQFPQVAGGLQALPGIVAELRAGATRVTAEQAHFESADAIPTNGTTSMAVPWFMLITGLLAVAAFGMASRRAGSSAAAVALGLIVLVLPLATSLPSKATNADALNDGIRPLFTQQQVEQLRGAAATLEGFGAELQTQLLPAVAELLDTTPEAVTQGISTFVPSVGAAIARAPEAIARLEATADTLEANLAEFDTVQGTSYAPIAWITVAAGIVIILAGAASFPGTRTTERGMHVRPILRRTRRAA